jgi:hypothetical protein
VKASIEITQSEAWRQTLENQSPENTPIMVDVISVVLRPLRFFVQGCSEAGRCWARDQAVLPLRAARYLSSSETVKSDRSNSIIFSIVMLFSTAMRTTLATACRRVFFSAVVSDLNLIVACGFE